jgi:hypothetical protein
MVAIGAREVPVTDEAGHFIGFVEEATLAREYLHSQRKAALERNTGEGG